MSDGIRGRQPITLDRIIGAGLKVVADDGYGALTVRAVAAVLGTGPSSLYAHIVNKADLDDLLVGHLHAQIRLPAPDLANWRTQIRDVCVQLRDQYLAYPGISHAALATMSADAATLRVSEGMLAILITGGIPPATAAWAIDALALYVAGYTLEISLVQQRQQNPGAPWILDRPELIRRLSALPEADFPHTTRYAAELTAGEGHQRFDFALDLLLNSLDPSRA
ncbi:TetR/AcrR family transcriptional regulator [Propionibacterium freudenreichii]|uniref:TetR/AcrR family transcriptional regulator n=1 Tax=Propionibacterium freudenreichii TaxID=1744 RepID=UPI000ADB9F7E|nr:TetR/AcrR family transcriptional regulator [Propionibacterium freudenreichii]